MTDHAALIDELSDGAIVVRPRTATVGRSALLAIAGATIALVFITIGFRADIMRGQPAPMMVVTAGLLMLVAVAAGVGAVRMARPQVGARSSGAAWVLAALMLVPVVAIVSVVAQPELVAGMSFALGLPCFAFGIFSGIGVFVFLTAWLRNGAPVSPESASWLVGIASGAVGGLAVTLECPHEPLAHFATWHVAAVPLFGLASRLILPRFLRW